MSCSPAISAISQTVFSIHDGICEGAQVAKRAFEKYCGCTVEELAQKVYNVSMFVFVSIVAALLYLSNSTFFVLGVVTAFFHKDSIDNAILRIQNTWLHQSYCRQASMLLLGALAWPITLSVASFLMGAHICSYLQDEAQVEGEDVDGHDEPPPAGGSNGLNVLAAAAHSPVAQLNAQNGEGQEGQDAALSHSMTGAFSVPASPV
jgi:hypothetical protein